MRENVVFVWGKWLPYHFSRVNACVSPFKRIGFDIIGVQYSASSNDYAINSESKPVGFRFLNPMIGSHETDFRPLKIAVFWPLFVLQHQVKVVFVPSYWDWSLTIAILSKMVGCRVVMMNESHAGTEKARGLKRWIKRLILRIYDSALVGGTPHRRHFINLGMRKDSVFTGYDCVDNDYYSRSSDFIRKHDRAIELFDNSLEISQATSSLRPTFTFRQSYRLPPRFFLSLGRMVPKKNLFSLIEAYSLFLSKCSDATSVSPPGSSIRCIDIPSLVFVGSGDCEDGLKALCHRLGLHVTDFSSLSPQFNAGMISSLSSSSLGTLAHPNKALGVHSDSFGAGESISSLASLNHSSKSPGVYFYGFRQIAENPVFYALADLFILPSYEEEWGLVVNEALASGLPAAVSSRAGCAHDLVSDPLMKDSVRDPCFPSRSCISFVFDPSSVSEISQVLFDYFSLYSDLGTTSSPGDMREVSRRIVSEYSCSNFANNSVKAIRYALKF